MLSIIGPSKREIFPKLNIIKRDGEPDDFKVSSNTKIPRLWIPQHSGQRNKGTRQILFYLVYLKYGIYLIVPLDNLR